MRTSSRAGIPSQGGRLDDHAGITVEEVLSVIPNVSLLGGEQGLTRLVRSVGVMETTAVFNLVKPGELIMTALYSVKDDLVAQLSLIPELHRRGAAALALKKRYVDRLPPEMIRQADHLGFPLLELPVESAFSDVMLPIFSQIVNRQASLLTHQQQAHKAVMKAALEARGLPTLARTLSELLENPVVIRDAAGQCLAVSTWAGDDALDVEGLSYLESVEAEYVTSGGETLHRTETVITAGRRLVRTVTPVLSGDRSFGQIMVWQIDHPVREMDLLIIESVCTVVALEIVSQRALLEVERRYKGEFLEALLVRAIDSEEALVGRARTFGWDLNRPHMAVAIRVTALESEPPITLAEEQQLKDPFFEAVARRAGQGMVGQASLHIAVLLQPRAGEVDLAAQALELLDLAKPFQKSLRVSAGIGRVNMGVLGLRKSFEEAVRSVQVGEKVWGGGGAYHYDDLGLFQILSMLEPNADMQPFMSAIDKLVDYEQDSRTDLIHTLEIYFACKGNVRKASERLFAHYNTVLYRLERIQQITGIQLEDASGRLHLQVALQAARLFGKISGAAEPAVRSL